MAPSGLLLCLVIGIADGDTLTARCQSPGGLQNHTVRIAEIDAPEARQPWGQRSRQSLATLCFKKPAQLTRRGEDRHGRLLAYVACDGVNAGKAQVKRGLAWVYDRYATEPDLRRLQQQARDARVGLWAAKAPVPPWVWRRQ